MHTTCWLMEQTYLSTQCSIFIHFLRLSRKPKLHKKTFSQEKHKISGLCWQQNVDLISEIFHQFDHFNRPPLRSECQWNCTVWLKDISPNDFYKKKFDFFLEKDLWKQTLLYWQGKNERSFILSNTLSFV